MTMGFLGRNARWILIGISVASVAVTILGLYFGFPFFAFFLFFPGIFGTTVRKDLPPTVPNAAHPSIPGTRSAESAEDVSERVTATVPSPRASVNPETSWM